MTKGAKSEKIKLMAKVLTINSSSNSSENQSNSEKENFLKKLWDSFQSLDKFNKIFILFILLFTITVPIVTKQYLDIRQRAQETPITPPFPIAGIFGKALKFDQISQSYFTINVPTFSNSIPNIAQPFTIEAFVKVNSFGNKPLGENHAPILARGFGETNRQSFTFSIDEKKDGTHKLSFIYYDAYGKPLLSLGGATDIKVGQWYHVAVTQDQSEMRRLFVNGIMDGEINAQGDITNRGDTLIIGASWDMNTGSRNFADMVIDEIRINKTNYYVDNFLSPLSLDKETAILWRFDDNYNNAASNSFTPNTYGNLQFVDSDIAVSNPYGLFEKAVKLNGTSSQMSVRVLTFSNSIPQIAAPFTIEGFIKINSFNTTRSAQNITPILVRNFYEKPERQSFMLYLDEDGMGKHHLSYVYLDSDGIAAKLGLNGKTNIEPNKWYHIAISQDSTYTIRLFVNGKFDGQTTYLGDITNRGSQLVFGRAWGIGSGKYYYTDGQFDQFRISNIARYTSDFTIPALFSLDDSNTKALWRFNGTASDSGPLNFSLLETDIRYVYSDVTPLFALSSPTPLSTSTPTPQIPTPILTPIVSAKRVFVTGTTYNGNLGGLSGADAKCQARADAANFGGTWKAWLSDGSTSAASKLNHSAGPYKLAKDSLNSIVANNWDDLVDSSALAYPIVADEFGKYWTSYLVWTNTDVKGQINTSPVSQGTGHCNNWTSTSSSDVGRMGSITKDSPNWTADPNGLYKPCDSTFMHLYCFEQTNAQL